MKAARRTSGGLFIRLLVLARPYWPQLAGCLLLSLLAVPLSLLTPVPLKIAVDNVIGDRSLPQGLAALLPAALAGSGTALLLFAAALMVVTVLLLQAQALLSWLAQAYIGQKLTLGFRARLFQHVQRLSLTYHDSTGSSDSTYRIQYDAPAIEHVVVNGVIPLVTSVATLLGMIWVTASMDWQLAVIALGVTPVLYILTAFYGARLRERWRDVKRSDSSAMAVVQEVLSSVRVVKAFGAEEREQQRFVSLSRQAMRKQTEVALMEGNYDLLVALTLAIGSALGLFFGVRQVQSGALSLGQLLMVMSYLAMLYVPLRTLSKKIADLQGGLASAERAFVLLDCEPEVAESADPKPIKRARGAIVFDRVSFSYTGGPAVLAAVSFEVGPGSRVGIRGATGAGKSTLMSLLTRFYDPTSGAILLDGTDLRQYRIKDLREQFAIVAQEPVLFATSIAENIAYGRPDAGDEQIAEAARLANAHEFIIALPDGYRTLVGERGMMLSGGERQRIALARAFLRDAPVLILDEPTSAVDVATEAKIVEAIERLMKGRTTFMVAHRLSTLRGCDLQLCVEAGRVRPLVARDHETEQPTA